MPTAASRRLEPRRSPPARWHPLTPAWIPSRRRASPSLTQFVVLSILLHALFILLFGSPAGGSREGRAMWGSLSVNIRGPLLDAGIATNADSQPRIRLPGSELLERRREVKPAATPPAPVAPTTPVALPAPETAPPTERAPPDPAAARVIDIAPVPSALLTTPVAPAATELVPAPTVQRLPPVAREIPVLSAPTLDLAPRPALDEKLAPAVELAPVLPRPIVVPVIPSTLMPTTALPAIAPTLAPAVDIAAPAPKAVQPAVPATAPAPATPAPATPAPATPAPAAPAPATQAPPTPAPAAQRPVPSGTEPPVSRAREPASPEGRPTRDSPVFDNRKPPGMDEPARSGAPRIDLDAARARAREVAREGSGNRALLPFPMPPAPERKTREQLAIEKAWKPDCKDAYKGLGLLAVVPLIANEIGEGSCRW